MFLEAVLTSVSETAPEQLKNERTCLSADYLPGALDGSARALLAGACLGLIVAPVPTVVVGGSTFVFLATVLWSVRARLGTAVIEIDGNLLPSARQPHGASVSRQIACEIHSSNQLVSMPMARDERQWQNM